MCVKTVGPALELVANPTKKETPVIKKQFSVNEKYALVSPPAISTGTVNSVQRIRQLIAQKLNVSSINGRAMNECADNELRLSVATVRALKR